MTIGNNISKRNHKTESGLIEIRFSGSNVSPIPMRFVCHLVKIRLIEVNFNDFQHKEVIFYHFYEGMGGLEVSEPLCYGIPAWIQPNGESEDSFPP